MYGVAAHRLFYTVGVSSPIGPGGSNGEFNNNSSKDFYARVDYKFGGMGLDGDTSGVVLPPENWRETSFRVGAFGYFGDGSGVDFEIADPDGNPFKMQQRRFNRVGVFGSLTWRDLNLIGVDSAGAQCEFQLSPARKHQINARIPPGSARLRKLPARGRPQGRLLKET